MLATITYLPRGVAYLFLYVLRGISYLFPRSKKIWIFDSWRGERFADNAKYLFLYAHSNTVDVKCVWLSRSREIIAVLRERGYEAHHVNSPWGLYYTLRSKVHIFDSHPYSFNYWVAGGALTLNLWHGLPFKKLFEDARATKQHNWLYASRGLRRLWHSYFNPRHLVRGEYVAIPGAFWTEIFSRAFRVPKQNLLIAGYMRNEVLSTTIKDSELGVDLHALETIRNLHNSGKKTVIYMPTFRDGKNNPILDGIKDFRQLDAFFREHDTHFFLKFHHEKTLILEGLTHIHVIDSATDAYPIVRYVDILITDYSGIFFDFLLLDRPIILFPFDIDDYTKVRREMYFDYDSMIAGPKAYTIDELQRYIRDALNGEDVYVGKRKEIREKIFDPGVNEHPSKMLCERLQAIL